jgi:hypothetical protein
MENKVTEAIDLESDLILKLSPIPEADIFEFMKNLKGGTYFNMGMYSNIPVSRAYKSTFRIYKVVEMSAIVSGVEYENISTTKDFRDQTGKTAGDSWYDHVKDFENKVAAKKSNPADKYILWNIKNNSGTNVRYYLVDIATGSVTPVTKEDVMTSVYLTETEKKKLQPQPVTGYNLTTGELVENKTVWRTAAFNHVFWLNQAGKATMEYGVKFTEDFDLQEEVDSDIFRDGHPNATADLDALLAGPTSEKSKFVDDAFFVDFE